MTVCAQGRIINFWAGLSTIRTAGMEVRSWEMRWNCLKRARNLLKSCISCNLIFSFNFSNFTYLQLSCVIENIYVFKRRFLCTMYGFQKMTTRRDHDDGDPRTESVAFSTYVMQNSNKFEYICIKTDVWTLGLRHLIRNRRIWGKKDHTDSMTISAFMDFKLQIYASRPTCTLQHQNLNVLHFL